jgi:hypothetical protein
VDSPGVYVIRLPLLFTYRATERKEENDGGNATTIGDESSSRPERMELENDTI